MMAFCSVFQIVQVTVFKVLQFGQIQPDFLRAKTIFITQKILQIPDSNMAQQTF